MDSLFCIWIILTPPTPANKLSLRNSWIIWLKIADNSSIMILCQAIGRLFFFVDRAAFPHYTCPTLFTNLYNRFHKDSQLYYKKKNKERGNNLTPDIQRCGKSSCKKRKNHVYENLWKFQILDFRRHSERFVQPNPHILV